MTSLTLAPSGPDPRHHRRAPPSRGAERDAPPRVAHGTAPLDHAETQDRLARAEESLAFALDASGTAGLWDWDLDLDRVRADAAFCGLFGIAPEAGQHGLPIGAFLEAVHPGDRDALSEAIWSAVRTGEPFSAEYRLQRPDGSVRWALARGRAVRDASGRVVRFPGVAVDITDRKEAEAALRESEARFRLIADTLPQIVWSTRPDGHHDYYNRRWYELTGTAPGETDGEGWAGMFHPEDRPRAWERWRRALATGEDYEVEYRMRAGGGWRWFLGRAVPVRDASGRIQRWFGTCTDVHDMRMAAEEREVLSHEMSHRIKNVFSVISSLISLSSRGRPEAAGFASDLRGRIAALARAHEFARPHSESSRPEVGTTTLFNFLRDLLSAYADPEARRLSFEGEDLVFDDGAATALALLFHELATNAAKYGALSGEAGRVTVSARREGGEAVLGWVERGGPTVSGPPPREGFGTRLATISVQGQLGGRVERRWPEAGLELEARLPAEGLRRRRAGGQA